MPADVPGRQAQARETPEARRRVAATMSYSLADLPLEFRPKKLAATMLLALLIALELVFAAVFVLVAKWPLDAFFTRGLASTLSFLFLVGACVWGIVDIQRKRDRLTIDETGVALELDGARRVWRWPDMARFHLVAAHPRSDSKFVAIEPKGAAAFDAKANLIKTKFGPETNDFLTILRAGKARWGAD
jgi:hypothetical protein